MAEDFPVPKRPKVCVLNSFIVFPIHKFFLFLDGSSGDESSDEPSEGSSDGPSDGPSDGSSDGSSD